jgi:hypothetical protein
LENPLFWLRLVGYAYARHRLVEEQGRPFGFMGRPVDVPRLLAGAQDDIIAARAADYAAKISEITQQGL